MSSLPALLIAFLLSVLTLLAVYILILRPLLARGSEPNSRQEPARTRRSAILLGLILIAGSLVCVLTGASAIRTSARAADWPETPGVIISSDYWKRSMADGQDQYIIEITYQFTVDGRTYTSDNIGWTSRFDAVSFRNQAEDIVAQYPAGTPIVVFYNPGDPRQSALDPGSGIGPESIVIGLVLLGAGSYSIWWAMKKN